jgi:hypothetical protein
MLGTFKKTCRNSNIMNFEFSILVRGLEGKRIGFQTCEFLAAGREKPLGFPIHFKC